MSDPVTSEVKPPQLMKLEYAIGHLRDKRCRCGSNLHRPALESVLAAITAQEVEIEELRRENQQLGECVGDSGGDFEAWKRWHGYESESK